GRVAGQRRGPSNFGTIFPSPRPSFRMLLTCALASEPSVKSARVPMTPTGPFPSPGEPTGNRYHVLSRDVEHHQRPQGNPPVPTAGRVRRRGPREKPGRVRAHLATSQG